MGSDSGIFAQSIRERPWMRKEGSFRFVATSPTALSMPSPDTTPYDVLILGAGAAGMMCAALAGQRGKRVALIEHADAPGKKILISGGGRCNFTNLGVTGERYLSQNPHFAKSALSRYTPQDFLALVERH
jgi:NADPH-dependent 2,4-dienoyl-CoA reductase/sulfur reductase-like enzyme